MPIDIDSLELDVSDEFRVEAWTGGYFAVRTLRVEFINKKFRLLTLKGADESGSQVVKYYNKVSKMPTWAVPWTVYGADEIAD